MSQIKISMIIQKLATIDNSNIVLLRNKEVLQWIFNDLSYLEKITKQYEDKWGQEIMKMKRPDLKLDKQWTNRFGEYVTEEIMTLLGNKVFKPIKKEHLQPDWETEDCILEVKTQTYLTPGTAGEKILGTPFKYAGIPRLYNKSLKIICLGNAEKLSRENYGNLPGIKMNEEKKKIIEFYKNELNIEYIGITDLLKEFIKK